MGGTCSTLGPGCEIVIQKAENSEVGLRLDGEFLWASSIPNLGIGQAKKVNKVKLLHYYRNKGNQDVEIVVNSKLVVCNLKVLDLLVLDAIACEFVKSDDGSRQLSIRGIPEESRNIFSRKKLDKRKLSGQQIAEIKIECESIILPTSRSVPSKISNRDEDIVVEGFRDNTVKTEAKALSPSTCFATEMKVTCARDEGLGVEDKPAKTETKMSSARDHNSDQLQKQNLREMVKMAKQAMQQTKKALRRFQRAELRANELADTLKKRMEEVELLADTLKTRMEEVELLADMLGDCMKEMQEMCALTSGTMYQRQRGDSWWKIVIPYLIHLALFILVLVIAKVM